MTDAKFEPKDSNCRLRDSCDNTRISNTEKINMLKREPVVIKFITSLIEDNFSRNCSPKWVNYDLFFEEKFGECFYDLVDNLRDDSEEYDDHALAFGYYSDNLDTGTGASHSAVDDFCRVEIPEKIIEIYKKYTED